MQQDAAAVYTEDTVKQARSYSTLNENTIKQLKEIANNLEISIKGLTRKGEIIAALINNNGDNFKGGRKTQRTAEDRRTGTRCYTSLCGTCYQ
jgi:hypothetical protein